MPTKPALHRRLQIIRFLSGLAGTHWFLFMTWLMSIYKIICYLLQQKKWSHRISPYTDVLSLTPSCLFRISGLGFWGISGLSRPSHRETSRNKHKGISFQGMNICFSTVTHRCKQNYWQIQGLIKTPPHIDTETCFGTKVTHGSQWQWFPLLGSWSLYDWKYRYRISLIAPGKYCLACLLAPSPDGIRDFCHL